MNDHKTIIIDVNLTRGLAVVLVVALVALALLAYLLLEHEQVSASSLDALTSGSAGMRQYYLTENDDYQGADADTACASGYHMASLWEILDTSNLKYNSDLGRTREDSGQGPPNQSIGWIRTGYGDGSTMISPGASNCRNWSVSVDPYRGTYAYLDYSWDNGADIGPWEFATLNCPGRIRVWCIED